MEHHIKIGDDIDTDEVAKAFSEAMHRSIYNDSSYTSAPYIGDPVQPASAPRRVTIGDSSSGTVTTPFIPQQSTTIYTDISKVIEDLTQKIASGKMTVTEAFEEIENALIEELEAKKEELERLEKQYEAAEDAVTVAEKSLQDIRKAQVALTPDDADDEV